jgi:hypothetical protein
MTDPLKNFPILYCLGNEKMTISDDYKIFNKSDFNDDAATGMKFIGHALGRMTLLKNVFL